MPPVQPVADEYRLHRLECPRCHRSTCAALPPGVPVATVAIGKPGATNAGVLAAQMIALADPNLAARLVAYKESLAEKVEAAAKRLENA